MKCDWIHLAQDRDRWRMLVKIVMGLPVHTRRNIKFLDYVRDYHVLKKDPTP